MNEQGLACAQKEMDLGRYIMRCMRHKEREAHKEREREGEREGERGRGGERENRRGKEMEN